MNFTPASHARLRKFRILRKKTVTGMDRICAASFRNVQYLGEVQIGFHRGCRSDVISLVGFANMQRSTIDVRVDRDRSDPKLAAGADHAYRNFSTVSD